MVKKRYEIEYQKNLAIVSIDRINKILNKKIGYDFVDSLHIYGLGFFQYDSINFLELEFDHILNKYVLSVKGRGYNVIKVF